MFRQKKKKVERDKKKAWFAGGDSTARQQDTPVEGVC